MFEYNEEQKLLLETVSNFALSDLAPLAARIDEEQEFNERAFRKMGALGLFGITIGEAYGGSGLGCLEALLVMEKMAEYCASTTLSYLAHAILCVNNLHENGSDSQRRKFLPKLLSGEWIGGMAMTEPGSGSDSLSLRTKATRKSGKYFLNGTKMFITNGPVGDLFVVYARTGEQKKEISTFLVEKSSPGFKVGKKLNKLGMRGSPTSELIFENCEVPEENRLGEENQSVQHMMRNLNMERITGSGIALGLASASLRFATNYAKQRNQFGVPIAQFEMIQERIAEMAARLDAGRALAFTAARAYDRGNRQMSLGSKVKLFAAQMATQACLDAIQILGGYGYIKEYPVERYMRDAKLMEIGAGTNEIMRILIARELLGLGSTL